MRRDVAYRTGREIPPMRSLRRYVAIGIAGLIVIGALLGCVHGVRLETETYDPKKIEGTYDLYLYGCRYPDDLEHAAFLIRPEKADMIELFVLDASYKIKRGLSAEKAIAEANTFVRCGMHTVDDIRVQRISDGSGGSLGYEILPRFKPFDRGGTDPLLVNYTLKEGKYYVYIQLVPAEEHILNLPSTSDPGGK